MPGSKNRWLRDSQHAPAGMVAERTFNRMRRSVPIDGELGEERRVAIAEAVDEVRRARYTFTHDGSGGDRTAWAVLQHDAGYDGRLLASACGSGADQHILVGHSPGRPYGAAPVWPFLQCPNRAALLIGPRRRRWLERIARRPVQHPRRQRRDLVLVRVQHAEAALVLRGAVPRRVVHRPSAAWFTRVESATNCGRG